MLRVGWDAVRKRCGIYLRTGAPAFKEYFSGQSREDKNLLGTDRLKPVPTKPFRFSGASWGGEGLCSTGRGNCEALPILEQRQRVQWQLRALQLKSDGDWPTLEYGMQMEWLSEASEVLTELLEQRLE